MTIFAIHSCSMKSFYFNDVGIQLAKGKFNVTGLNHHTIAHVPLSVNLLFSHASILFGFVSVLLLLASVLIW